MQEDTIPNMTYIYTPKSKRDTEKKLNTRED
jgi:hypothetical protein